MNLTETYTLYDYLFYDEATSDAKASTNYANVTTDRSYSENGTTLSKTATSGTTYCNTLIGSSQTWFDSTKKYQVEFDFSWERDSTNSNVGFGFGSDHYNVHNWFGGALTGSGHMKIITDGNTWTPYLDNVQKASVNITGTNGFAFHIYRTGSITFKDLKIWEI